MSQRFSHLVLVSDTGYIPPSSAQQQSSSSSSSSSGGTNYGGVVAGVVVGVLALAAILAGVFIYNRKLWVDFRETILTSGPPI